MYDGCTIHAIEGDPSFPTGNEAAQERIQKAHQLKGREIISKGEVSMLDCSLNAR